MDFCTFEQIEAHISALRVPALVAIDGLPCSGKSTLARRLRKRFASATLHLDDFVLPKRDWQCSAPAFPFGFIRGAELVAAVEELASTGECSYRPFDWSTRNTSSETRVIRRDTLVIVEGVAALQPALSPLYGLRIFVESDRATTLQAALDRGVGPWAAAWQELLLPSVDLYMQTSPEKRADLIFAGRGALGNSGS